MSKPTQSHLDTAQRIYDRLGRGSVADIDAIARALSAAHQDGIREGKRQAAEMAQAKADGIKACMLRYFEGGHCIDFQRYQEGCEAVAADILATITDESE